MRTAKEFLRQFIVVGYDVHEPTIIAAMKEFAIEVAKEALNNASKNAFMKWHCGQYKTDTPTQYHQSGSDNIQIDKSSILHEYNIPKL